MDSVNLAGGVAFRYENSRFRAASRGPRSLKTLTGVVLLASFTAAGCTSRTVVFRSTPTGARVHVNGVDQGQTPFETTLQWPNETTIHRIVLEADDYEREERRLTRQAALKVRGPWKFDIELARLARVFDVRVESTPAGASARVEGRDCGTTPADIAIRFTRASSGSPWGTARITVDAEDYERGEQTITYEEALTSATPWKLPFELKRLVEVFDVRIETSPP